MMLAQHRMTTPITPNSSPMNPASEHAREAEWVRRIHRAVGGPAKLSTYDDPAAVREVVLVALAEELPHDAQRIARGDLSPFERRVVRTVTNRGAAVRSRMRQRRELARLRDELRRKDERIAKLEAALASLTNNATPGASAVNGSMAAAVTAASLQTQPQPPPLSLSQPPTSSAVHVGFVPSTQITNLSASLAHASASSTSTHSSIGSGGGGGGITPVMTSPHTQQQQQPQQLNQDAERDTFGNLIDQLLSRI